MRWDEKSIWLGHILCVRRFTKPNRLFGVIFSANLFLMLRLVHGQSTVVHLIASNQLHSNCTAMSNTVLSLTTAAIAIFTKEHVTQHTHQQQHRQSKKLQKTLCVLKRTAKFLAAIERFQWKSGRQFKFICCLRFSVRKAGKNCTQAFAITILACNLRYTQANKV